MALECCEQGDLARVLESHREQGTVIPEQQLWVWFRQITDAVCCMHEHRVMHRDIKPNNIFVTTDGTAKIGDLGLSRFMSSQTMQVQSMVGTPCYMSPEVIRGLPYDFSSDVWGLGCLLYEMTALKVPFYSPKLNYYTLGKKITTCDYEPLPDSVSPAIRDTVGLLLRSEPQDRPTAQQLLDRVSSFLTS